jgi:hypothetical protein
MILKTTEKMPEKMIQSIAAAALFSLALGAALAPSAFAQAKPASAPKSQQAPPAKDSGQPADSASEDPAPAEDAAPNFAPVLYVTSVEAMRSTHEPALDVIRVRGLTSSEGWESGELVPLTKGKPADGILDLAFIAQAPTAPATPSKNPEIEAVFTMEPGHPFKGVRVYAATNRVTIHAIPGYAEAPAAPNDCSECLGKYYLPKGETAPAGVSADSIVREESLPTTLHVIKAGEGIRKLDTDPNRLTLVLNDEGRIVIAVWD